MSARAAANRDARAMGTRVVAVRAEQTVNLKCAAPRGNHWSDGQHEFMERGDPDGVIDSAWQRMRDRLHRERWSTGPISCTARCGGVEDGADE